MIDSNEGILRPGGTMDIDLENEMPYFPGMRFHYSWDFPWQSY
jgi:hypothetical protein